jgi:hypothetical protein
VLEGGRVSTGQKTGVSLPAVYKLTTITPLTSSTLVSAVGAGSGDDESRVCHVSEGVPPVDSDACRYRHGDMRSIRSCESREAA